METSNTIAEDWGKALTAIQKRQVEKKVLLECAFPALEAEIASFGRLLEALNLSEPVIYVLAEGIARLSGRVSHVRKAVEKL